MQATQRPMHFRSDWLWVHNILPGATLFAFGFWRGYWTAANVWGVALVVAATSVMVFIALRTRLTVDGSSFEVVNTFRSWKVDAIDIAYFEQPTKPLLDLNRTVSMMRLRDGTGIRVNALSRPQLFPNGPTARNLHRTIAGLNRYVAEHGGRPETPSG